MVSHQPAHVCGARHEPSHPGQARHQPGRGLERRRGSRWHVRPPPPSLIPARLAPTLLPLFSFCGSGMCWRTAPNDWTGCHASSQGVEARKAAPEVQIIRVLGDGNSDGAGTKEEQIFARPSALEQAHLSSHSEAAIPVPRARPLSSRQARAGVPAPCSISTTQNASSPPQSWRELEKRRGRGNSLARALLNTTGLPRHGRHLLHRVRSYRHV